MPTDLSKITDLMNMQVAASQTRLRQVMQREDKLLSMLTELDAHITSSSGEGANAQIADFLNDVQLRRWVDQRRASVNTELAQTRALRAMAQADLVRHFARQQAADALVKAHADREKQLNARKTYWAS